MDEGSKNILPYARAERGRWWKGWRWAWKRVVITGFIGLLFWGFVHGPTSGQIRIDTGDLRYCWVGIPLEYEQMPEPQRSKLLALAARAPAIPAQWETCVIYPLEGSNNPDSMCQYFYGAAAAWSDAYPKIARWALEDLADYVRSTHASRGLPRCTEVMGPGVVDGPLGAVNPGWQGDEEIREYCAEHGYVPAAVGAR